MRCAALLPATGYGGWLGATRARAQKLNRLLQVSSCGRQPALSTQQLNLSRACALCSLWDDNIVGYRTCLAL
jgi:hypothetical protein